MRIAIDMLPGLQTGAGWHQRQLIGALADCIGSELGQITCFAFGTRYPPPDWLPAPVGYVQSGLPGRAQKLLCRGLRLPAEMLFRIDRPDVVHTLVLHPLRTGAPLVVQVHDVSWRYFCGQYRTTFSPRQVRRAEAAIRAADHIVTLSRASADDIIRGGVPADRVSVTYLWADDRFTASRAGAVEQARTAHGLPDEFILYVGGINERKNLPVLTAALSLLTPRPPLVLVGPPPVEGLAYWQLDHPRVQHLGYVADDDLPGLYQAASCLVLPSKLEGFGLPLVEAMAAGTTVLASDIAVFRELGGAAVQFFDPDDAPGLASLIRANLADAARRAEQAARGVEQARRFSRRDFVASLLNAYRCASRR
jgi:glycosyltransferase involved in cell wall biosynthesis